MPPDRTLGPWQVKSIWPRFMLDAMLAENPLANLLPSHTGSWWPLVEDIFQSPACLRMKSSLLTLALQQDEYVYVSMDGTFRVCTPLIGQARFNAPAQERAAYPFNDETSYRRVISLRGRTGAVLGLVPANGESAEELARCVASTLTDSARAQVRYIATDEPSNKLCLALKDVLPNLEALALDPTHTAMKYEQATNGRKTKGSALLRAILAKFCPRTGARRNIWGSFYDGSATPRLSAPEKTLREQILDGSLSQRRAARVLKDMVPLDVWPTRIQFVEAVAALAAVHQNELGRKLEGTKLTVAKVLYQATAPERVEWFLNNARLRGSLPPASLHLLPSGTTGNEALHAELNAWFRQVQRLHRSTLQLKLDVLHLAKLLPHQLALTMPTSRQMASGHILARRLGSPLWTKTGWKEWVAESRDRISQRQLKLSAHRLEEAALAKSIPAAYKRPASSGRKRTPFTLERARGVQRAGVHLRRPAAKRQRTQSDVDE